MRARSEVRVNESIAITLAGCRGILSRTALIALCLVALSGCLDTPDPEQMNALLAGGIPDHSAFGSTPCEDCHTVDRPAPQIDATTGAPIIHGGNRDCGECHVAGGANWRTFIAFSHVPVPETCDDCHLETRPAVLVNDNMLHTYPGVGDCVGCHAAEAGVTWAGASYEHNPLPTTCAECHSGRRFALGR